MAMSPAWLASPKVGGAELKANSSGVHAGRASDSAALACLSKGPQWF